ncbi:hypothetical protein AVEN_260667-1 [Araneus ventricosus]|uniref:Uncharacterized protein n=1 Tax=Araneus ventricosus TaxID=182803 RepID=A0A4Y2WAJ5_ARAVE|nr:hypothetical protein AVEN_138958-1 [Araneus ventricosus]GBN84036.1 hypothetical protein AVEN_173191-1 [Araneus ventricosus]GBN84050.1 hypothetical protein AVEN_181406-1 [Araneus ventricosus]GBN84061.1 hypothetical protein AVEN_70492-1 [Araneus ventricosus]GBO33614.1 hypothetical protein AVEN_260667-1 [Araneus ventricosus]
MSRLTLVIHDGSQPCKFDQYTSKPINIVRNRSDLACCEVEGDIQPVLMSIASFGLPGHKSRKIMCMCVAHAGSIGNERADQLAKRRSATWATLYTY